MINRILMVLLLVVVVPTIILVAISKPETRPKTQTSTTTTEIPTPVGHVNDFANIIDDAEEKKLEAELTAFPHEIAVLTVATTHGMDIAQYGIKVADQWKVGDAALDDGVIFIIAYNDHKARIEVGSGAEAYITDSQAGAILDDHVIPQFKQNNYTAGIMHGVHAIIGAF